MDKDKLIKEYWHLHDNWRDDEAEKILDKFQKYQMKDAFLKGRGKFVSADREIEFIISGIKSKLKQNKCNFIN